MKIQNPTHHRQGPRESVVQFDHVLDWTARQSVGGKRGKTPDCVPPIFQRLGLAQASWCELVTDFGKLFSCVAGKPSAPSIIRSLSARSFCSAVI